MTPSSVAGVVVLADDGLGVAERLSRALASRGWDPVVIGGDVDLADGQALTEAVRRVRAERGPVRGVLHLASLGGGPDPERVDLDGWRRELRRQVTSLFHLARAVSTDVLEDPASWWMTVTGLGGDVATATEPGGAGAAGLTRALAEEARCRVRLVHLPPVIGGHEEHVELAMGEIERLGSGTDLEVAYAEGRRLRPGTRAAPLPSTAGALVSAGNVVLLTGGARGITAHVAHELAVPGTTLVLVGRSAGPTGPEPPETAAATDERALRTMLVEAARRAGSPVDLAAVTARARTLMADREARATVASLRAAGARVDYRAADLRDEVQVVALLDDLRATYGRLDGVVHGAGVLDDGPLRDKTLASFEHVLGTKADSAYLLARHLDPASVRFLVLFASVAGRFGNAGQTDYAAANEVLVALARRLHDRWPGRVVALCWGPWAGAGMVTPELEQRFRERGVEPLTPELGRRLFRDELVGGPRTDAVVVLGRGPWGDRPEPVPAMPLGATAGGLETVLDPDTDGYLDDHRLDGDPVLPAAMAAELLAEAAEVGHPGLRLVELQDLAVLEGVVLTGGPVRLWVSVEEPEPSAGGGARCAVALGRQGADGASYRAVAVLAPDAPAVPGLDAAVAGDVPEPPAVGTAYGELLFHGPLLRGLDSLDADATGWTARVHVEPPARWTSRSPGGPWVLDPSLLDLGPQLAILWSRARHGTTTLPVRFGTIRRGRATGDTTGLSLRFRVRPGDDPAWQVADVEVRNPDGCVRLAVTGLEAAGSAALNRLARSVVAAR